MTSTTSTEQSVINRAHRGLILGLEAAQNRSSTIDQAVVLALTLSTVAAILGEHLSNEAKTSV